MNATLSHEHVWRLDDLHRAVQAAGVALWSWNVDDDRFNMDEQARRLWGLPGAERVSLDRLLSQVHPRDRDRVRTEFLTTRDTTSPYEFDFCTLHCDEVRWISARGEGGGVGDQGTERSVFGVFLDVTGRKQAEEGHELLAGEMSHRVKNLLAIAAGLTTITWRSATTTNDMARELIQRLTALGRAHDLVRPLPGQASQAAQLGDLLAVLLAPYDDTDELSGRIQVAVQHTSVGEKAATTLALIVYELATNSLKYGALTTAGGTLDIASKSDGDETVLLWTERGGPRIDAPVDPGGYGSQLINRSVSGQLGGSIVYNWSPAGLIVTLRMKTSRLAT